LPGSASVASSQAEGPWHADPVRPPGDETGSLDDLFGTVPTEDRPAFQKLRQALQEQLSGVKVYTVGDESERQVYVVGKTKDGKRAGLKTSVVAT
jgi:hypothetical protein